MDIKVKAVDPRTLVSQIERRQSNQRSTFKMLLNKCYHRIKYYHSIGYQECLFEIPPIVIGFPLYNHTEVMEYILQKIERQGFYVVPSYNNFTLYISWRPTDLKQGSKERQSVRSSMNQGFLGDLPVNQDVIQRMSNTRN